MTLENAKREAVELAAKHASAGLLPHIYRMYRGKKATDNYGIRFYRGEAEKVVKYNAWDKESYVLVD